MEQEDMGKKWKRVALSCSQHGYQQSAGTMSESRWQPFYIFRIIAAPSTLPVGSLPGVFWCETFRCEKCMYVCENIWTWPDIIPTGEKKNRLTCWKLKHAFQFPSCLSMTNDPSFTFLSGQHRLSQFRRQQTCGILL